MTTEARPTDVWRSAEHRRTGRRAMTILAVLILLLIGLVILRRRIVPNKIKPTHNGEPIDPVDTPPDPGFAMVDRCDHARCGQMSRVVWEHPHLPGRVITLCAHHSHELAVPLGFLGWAIAHVEPVPA